MPAGANAGASSARHELGAKLAAWAAAPARHQYHAGPGRRRYSHRVGWLQSLQHAYVVEGASINFGAPAAATMMACPQPVMDQAKDLSCRRLGRRVRTPCRATSFPCSTAGRCSPPLSPPHKTLAGTQWQVTAYNNGREAVVSVSLGSEITAAFDATGQVTGNAGCNDYFAPYQASGGAISIGAAGATRKSCASPAGVMEQESAYLAALQSAATYTIEADRLEMRDATGAIAVQMARSIEIAVATPAPSTPTGRVTAPSGVNVRSGPGTNYPVIGVAPFGAEGAIVGRTADSQWWAVSVPSAPGGIGWVSDDYVAVTGAEDVPVIVVPPPVYVPPAPAPAPTPTPVPPPTATPSAQMAFWADQTTINQGECTTLHWSVENVQAVWVYPQGQPYQQYPQTGQGSQQVCPPTTTTYEMLVLKRDGTTTTMQVTITVIPAAPQNPLAGTSWLASSYNNGAGARRQRHRRHHFDGRLRSIPDQRQRRLQRVQRPLLGQWLQYRHRSVGDQPDDVWGSGRHGSGAAVPGRPAVRRNLSTGWHPTRAAPRRRRNCRGLCALGMIDFGPGSSYGSTALLAASELTFDGTALKEREVVRRRADNSTAPDKAAETPCHSPFRRAAAPGGTAGLWHPGPADVGRGGGGLWQDHAGEFLDREFRRQERSDVAQARRLDHARRTR